MSSDLLATLKVNSGSVADFIVGCMTSVNLDLALNPHRIGDLDPACVTLGSGFIRVQPMHQLFSYYYCYCSSVPVSELNDSLVP